MMNSPDYFTDQEYALKTLSNLGPGETYVYFVGFLDEQRLQNPHSSPCLIADAAYRLALAGKIHLTQERLSSPVSRGEVNWSIGCGSGFRYRATGAKPKRKIGL